MFVLDSPDVLVTLTADIGKILTSLHHVQINGKSKISTGIQIAQVFLINKACVKASPE